MTTKPDEEQADLTLDARGLDCPLPILRTRQAIKRMSPASTLLVFATDSGSVLDFQAFCRITGNDLLQMSESDEEFRFLIRKRG